MEITVSWFEQDETRFGTPGERTFPETTPAPVIFRYVGKLTDNGRVLSVDVTGGFAQVHLFRDSAGTWIYQTIGTSA